jgi:hypothetical protein
MQDETCLKEEQTSNGVTYGSSRRVLLCVVSATKNQPVAEVKAHHEGLECMHAKENKSNDISHMQH